MEVSVMGIPVFFRAPVLDQMSFVDFYDKIGRLNELAAYSDALSGCLVSGEGADIEGSPSLFDVWRETMLHDDSERFLYLQGNSQTLSDFLDREEFHPCIAAWALRERELGKRQETDMIFNHFNLSKVVIILDRFNIDFKADWELLKTSPDLQQTIILLNDMGIDLAPEWDELKADEDLQKAVIMLHEHGIELYSFEWNEVKFSKELQKAISILNSSDIDFQSDWKLLRPSTDLQQTVILLNDMGIDIAFEWDELKSDKDLQRAVIMLHKSGIKLDLDDDFEWYEIKSSKELQEAICILGLSGINFQSDWKLLKAKANLQKAIIAVSEAVGRNIQTTWGSIDIQSAWKALKDDEKLQQAVIALHDAGVDLSAREPSCGGNLWNSLSDWQKLVTNKQLQQTVINFSSIPADNLPYVSITDFSYHQIFKRYAAMLALSRSLGRALSSEESEMVDDDLISEISALADGVADYTGQLTPNNFLMSSSVCSILLGHVMSEDSLRTEEDKAIFHIHKLFKPLICNCDNETDRKALIDCRNKVLQETQRFCMARDLQGENAYIPPPTREMDRSLDFNTFDAKISSYASECESKLSSNLSKFQLMWNKLKFNLCKVFGVSPKASNPYKIATQMFSAIDNIKHCHFNEESSAMRSIG
jgi:hypothetical protein